MVPEDAPFNCTETPGKGSPSPLISYFQTRVPLEQQGRFFALLAFFSGILIPLGISYTGVLADWLGPGAAYACNNLCVIVLVLLVRLPA